MAGDREKADAASGHEPERTCVVARVRLHPDDLIRFVRGPDGTIVPDLAGKLPGRGVWVACRSLSVAEAASRNAFARSLKGTVIVPPGLAELVGDLLARRAVASLALANKAGLVATGFTKVENAIDAGEAVAIVQAADASDDGKGKLERKFRQMRAELAPGEEARIVTALTNAELSLAMGRSNVVHAALSKGGAANAFLRDARRLQRYRTDWNVMAGDPPQQGLDTEQA